MPTYDFVCLDCGRPYEVRCAIQQRDQARCPECGSIHKRQDYRASAVLGTRPHGGGRSLPAAAPACG